MRNDISSLFRFVINVIIFSSFVRIYTIYRFGTLKSGRFRLFVFVNWLLFAGNATTGDIVGVNYLLFGHASGYTDQKVYDGTGNPIVLTKSQPLWFPPLNVTTTWEAAPFLRRGSTTYTGSIVDFVVDADATSTTVSTSTLIGLIGLLVGGGETSSTLATPTTNCQYTSSSFFGDPVGNIQQGICQALVFLFIPNSAQQTNLTITVSTTFNPIRTKIPFGYIPLIASSTAALTTSTATTTSLYLPPVVANTIDLGLAAFAGLLVLGFLWAFIHHFEF